MKLCVCQRVLFLINVMSQAMAEIILALRRMMLTANCDSLVKSKEETKSSFFFLSSCCQNQTKMSAHFPRPLNLASEARCGCTERC